MFPTMVIIGRRNVGKSALFNRLIEENKAIVSEIEGTTRDRTEGICIWRGEKIRVVDTGGLDIGDENTINREIKKQARFAMKQADVILFLVDARVGPLPGDRKLAKELRRLLTTPNPSSERRGNESISPPVPLRGIARRGTRGGVGGGGSVASILLVANKAETKKWQEQSQSASWKTLQLGIPLSISALTGQGVGDLLDEIFQHVKVNTVNCELTTVNLRIAIIGKPNVGKSSLLNKILGEERVIVSPVPHTTREPQDTLFMIPTPPFPPLNKGGMKGGLNILLIDTAGIRRKARIEPGIEKAGVTKTMAVINKADVVFFVLDAVEGIDVQDKHLAGMIEEKGVGVIIVANKWDILGIKNEELRIKNRELFIKMIHFGLPGIGFAPVVPISALTGHNVHKLLSLALKIQENRNRIIPSEELKNLLPKLILRHKPTKGKGTRHPIIRRIEQIATAPPCFQITIGPKQSLHESYLRYVQNRLREFYDFEGTPIRVFVKQEKN